MMKRRMIAVVCLMAAFALAGCDGADGATGQTGPQGLPGEACFAMDNRDGSYTISCPDSMPITLRSGTDGTDGKDGADGKDGMDGQPGAPGMVGPGGPPGTPGMMGMNGADGQACTITENADGSIGLQCGDGPTYRLETMRAGGPMGGAPAAPGDLGDPDEEGIGEPCSFMEGDFSFSGFCADRTRFQCGGMYYSGACPGGDNIQCCGNHPCQTNDGRDGVCRDANACDTQSVPGLCPGNNAVQCCLLN